MTFQGRDIFDIPVPRSGASYSPEFEAREAARWAGYIWPAFCDLDGVEQSKVVAQFRCHHQLEAVVQKAEMDKIKNRPKAK